MNLYKYISSNLWNSILPYKLIRFTQPPLLNDPFELQVIYSSLAETDGFKDQLNEANVKSMFRDQFEEVKDQITPEMQALFTPEFLDICIDFLTPSAIEYAPAMMDELIMPAMQTGFYKGFSESLGILSLTEKYDNLLMWAHYAENHKGFVIGFDGENDFFHHKHSEDDELRHIRKVQYSEERPNIQLNIIDDMADIFLTKSKEWEYEQEWRMLERMLDANKTIQKNDEAICLFSFPAECVKEVILGCRMLPSIRREIIDYLVSDEQYSAVKIYEAGIDEKEFKLNIIPADI